jgi:hypothetical protein
VFAPCTCWACKEGREWWRCETQELVANYMCSPRYVDCPDVPAPEMVRAIEADHPCCTLVYID